MFLTKTGLKGKSSMVCEYEFKLESIWKQSLPGSLYKVLSAEEKSSLNKNNKRKKTNKMSAKKQKKENNNNNIDNVLITSDSSHALQSLDHADSCESLSSSSPLLSINTSSSISSSQLSTNSADLNETLSSNHVNLSDIDQLLDFPNNNLIIQDQNDDNQQQQQQQQQLTTSFALPKFKSLIDESNYQAVLNIYKFTVSTLSEELKFRNLRVGGSKKEMIDRLYLFFFCNSKAKIIQHAIRSYFVKSVNKKTKEIKIMKSSCVNHTDFYTLDELTNIPDFQCFCFYDKDDNKTYGFDISSLFHLVLELQLTLFKSSMIFLSKHFGISNKNKITSQIMLSKAMKINYFIWILYQFKLIKEEKNKIETLVQCEEEEQPQENLQTNNISFSSSFVNSPNLHLTQNSNLHFPSPFPSLNREDDEYDSDETFQIDHLSSSEVQQPNQNMTNEIVTHFVTTIITDFGENPDWEIDSGDESDEFFQSSMMEESKVTKKKKRKINEMLKEENKFLVLSSQTLQSFEHFLKTKFLNPYNRKPFSIEFIYSFLSFVLRCKTLKFPLMLIEEIEEENESCQDVFNIREFFATSSSNSSSTIGQTLMSPSSAAASSSPSLMFSPLDIEHRITTFCQLMQEMGNNCEPSWIINLTCQQWQRFVVEFDEIWYRRASLTEVDRRRLAPPTGRLFPNVSDADIQRCTSNINHMRALLFPHLESFLQQPQAYHDQQINSFYIIGALTLVSIPARTSHQAIAESFAY